VAVVGAGAAGLAAAAVLQSQGAKVVVLEQADAVGASWRSRYDRLRLNSLRWLSDQPGYRMSREYGGRWVSRDEFVRYLEDYARHHRLDIRFGRGVQRVDRDGRLWNVRQAGKVWRARDVVIATGFDRVPFIPNWPGSASPGPELTHSASYRNATAYHGREVLVVGAGNSGAEIAVDLCEGGAASVRVAMRTIPNFMPRQLWGIPLHPFAVINRSAPDALQDRTGRLVQRLAFGDLRRTPIGRAEKGFATYLHASGVQPTVDSGFIAAVRARRIEIVGAVEAFADGGVVLRDGAVVRPDAVIAATGYRRGLEDLVGHLGVLGPDGRPTVDGAGPTPVAPGLYFSGYTTPFSGHLRELGRNAKRISRCVARDQRPSPAVSSPEVSSPELVEQKDEHDHANQH
jgi:putative flavoprotein involved in K+ transport